MSALRAIGACWRCKFLRKPCDPETRCGWCPRPKENGSSKEVLSAWADLGCQRGTFESSTHPIVLCPNSFTIFSSDYDYTKCGSILDATLWITARQNALNQANRLWRTNLLERDKALEKIGHSMAGSENSLSPHNRRVRDVFVECFLESSFSNLDEEWPKPELIPLNECILAIAWESATSELESLVKLLPRAAAYQADHQQDQLIAQSFICLRSCLEAMRVKSSYNKDDHLPHDQCVVASCQIECFAELKKNISLYLTELSRVFFKKANMRNKQQWWLSCFYSFCIQSLVKKLLLALETRQSDGGFLACREYLQLPIKLFIAISSNHDPLVADIKKFGELELGRIPPNLHDEEEANYKVAQIAVDRCKWKADGVSGSAEYLRRLFANFEAVEQTKSTRQNADRQVIIEID
ncbi:hypothetical protein N431DRAFT_345414 [Stipitochalara longipes BDJ]|nr:hypothetical protein N431DRAFT_345414 [Stipitochalara longipes BDJ]